MRAVKRKPFQLSPIRLSHGVCVQSLRLGHLHRPPTPMSIEVLFVLILLFSPCPTTFTSRGFDQPDLTAVLVSRQEFPGGGGVLQVPGASISPQRQRKAGSSPGWTSSTTRHRMEPHGFRTLGFCSARFRFRVDVASDVLILPTGTSPRWDCPRHKVCSKFFLLCWICGTVADGRIPDTVKYIGMKRPGS